MSAATYWIIAALLSALGLIIGHIVRAAIDRRDARRLRDTPTLGSNHYVVADEAWRTAADWLEAYGEHELTRQQEQLLKRMYDAGLMKPPPYTHIESLGPWDVARFTQQDYPPPLRRPTGDDS